VGLTLRISRSTPWPLVGVLLLTLFVQIVLGGRLLSATFDETTHLPSGYSYLKTGDLRLNTQHPPLIKMLAALPLLPLGPELDLEDPAWQATPPDEWSFGYRFLYNQNADRLLFWGRLPMALLALLMAWYVFRWAVNLFGIGGGLLALFLCAFSPTLIAHARFVTMDVGLAAFSTLGLYHLWRYLEDGRSTDMLATSVGLGLALASKFSGVILVPVYAVLLLSRPFARDRLVIRAGSGRTVLSAVTSLALILALAGVIVHAIYLFPPDPATYWNGLVQVNQDHDPDYFYYLMGEFKQGGWWYYFLSAFLFKTPVPTLLAIVLSLVLVWRYRAPHPLAEVTLLLPIVAFTAATSVWADNLGIRYLMPVYPLLFVFVGRLAGALRTSLIARGAAVVLGLWYAGSTTAIYPDQLAYFNEMAGGSSNGHRLLDDSNIDWGQDLKRLKRYMSDEGITRIHLRYGRNSAPEYYGIKAFPVSDEQWARERPPGYYAFGAQQLIRGELYREQHGLATDWLNRYEPVARIGYSLYVFEFR
jgi:hypothetical protein